MHRAQVPGGIPHPQLSQVAEPGRHLEANAFQRERAIAAALSASHLLGEGQLQFFGGAAGLRHAFAAQKALQRCRVDLRVDFAVVFQLDPGLADIVELIQSQIRHAFEHGQEATLDLAPKRLLLSVLIRRIYERVLGANTQASKPLFSFLSDHCRAVVEQ